MSSANLAELPADITLQILRHVAGPQSRWRSGWPELYRYVPEGESLKAIQSVRLACRSLSQIAIPILFPVPRVSINYRSIDAFEQLSKNPNIAAQAQGVRVDVATFSRDMATDLGAFKDKQMKHIDKAFHRLNYEMEFRLYEEDEESADVKEYYRVENVYGILRSAWNRIAPTKSTGGRITRETDATTEEMEGKFGGILLRSHREYARRHREQIDCLNDAQAMERLVKAVMRLKCKAKVHFSEDVPESSPTFGYGLLIGELLDNQQALFQALVQPHDWQGFYGEDGETEPEMVKLLSSLPIAFAEAGIPCTELYLDCFPRYSGFRHLLRPESQTAEELENQLKTAFRHLQMFDFGYRGMNCRTIRHNPISESDSSYMRAYLAAGVASPELHELHITLDPYGINTGRGRKDEPQFKIGTLLQPLVSQQLTRVSVSGFEATSDELALFLSRLGTKLRSFFIYSIFLLKGSWAPLLDAVRENTAQRCQDGLCWASLSSLYGAEFGHTRPKTIDVFTTTAEEREVLLREPRLLRKAQSYIRGKRLTNPLRIVGEDPESSGDDDDSVLIDGHQEILNPLVCNVPWE